MVGGMLFLACRLDFRPGRPSYPGTTGSGTTVFHGAGMAGTSGYGSGTVTLFHGTPGRRDPADRPRPRQPRDGHRFRLGDRRQVRRCPPAERTPPRSGRRTASICAAVVGLRRRCPATPHVAVLAARRCCYRSLRAVLVSLFGDAGFVVFRRRESRPNLLINRLFCALGGVLLAA
jgi:hypothetical protein